jgi:hypothetical protein
MADFWRMQSPDFVHDGEIGEIDYDQFVLFHVDGSGGSVGSQKELQVHLKLCSPF